MKNFTTREKLFIHFPKIHIIEQYVKIKRKSTLEFPDGSLLIEVDIRYIKIKPNHNVPDFH